MAWTAADIPSQRGRVAVVTGATNGLGFETALALAGAGATVVLAARDAGRGRDAVARITARPRDAPVTHAILDLASLASVAAFAEGVAATHPAIDVLVNNAGIMAVPKRQTTTDGFEMQLGVNYLGHFALTARLLPNLLRATHPARVVSLSSIAHRRGRIVLDDLQGARRYRDWEAYAQSKLAMLVFARTLERRARGAGWPLLSLAAHPGFARTNIAAVGPRIGRHPDRPVLVERLFRWFGPFVAQDAAQGALPTLYAATAPEARGGGYYGPTGLGEFWGPPGPARVSPQAMDEAVADRLWADAERLTGVAFSAPRVAA